MYALIVCSILGCSDVGVYYSYEDCNHALNVYELPTNTIATCNRQLHIKFKF